MRGVVHEGDIARGGKDRRAVDLVGHIGRIAAARETGELDVGAGLAAARLGPHAGHDLQQVGGTRGGGVADLLQARGGDLEARIEFFHASGGGRARHHDFIQCIGVGRAGIGDRGWAPASVTAVLSIGMARRPGSRR